MCFLSQPARLVEPWLRVPQICAPIHLPKIAHPARSIRSAGPDRGGHPKENYAGGMPRIRADRSFGKRIRATRASAQNKEN